MTLETAPADERRFLRAGLCWLVAAAALAFYLATLNHWLAFNSLPLVARVNGWDWRPVHSQPLLFLLTWPCRWLPATAVPLVLNLLTASGASLTLALLARSVVLLPQDRLKQQRLQVQNPQALLSVSNAWVPPLLAALALGLQLSFWDNATSSSGEMLDLLLFAYIIRCLLEYRLQQRRPWLDRAALVCGLAMANSWFVVAFLPVFVLALLCTKPLSFFKLRFFRRIEESGWQPALTALGADLRFLVRMAMLGLAGLSLVLLVPLAQALSPDVPVGFGQALRGTAASYKTVLLLLGRVFLRHEREAALLLVAVSLLPVLGLSIRWRAFATGKSPFRVDLASSVLYVAHVFLLLLCFLVPFDPPFSPRQLGHRLGFVLSFLPFYYLSALSLGYYSGFFLLVFRDYTRSRRLWRRVLGWAAPTLIWLLLGVTLAGLLLKNLPVVRASHRPFLDQYAGWLARSLPPEGGLVLADDPLRLTVLRTALARGTNANRYLLAELPALPFPAYRAYLCRQQPTQWPELAPGPRPTAAPHSAGFTNLSLDTVAQLELMARLVENHRVFYLQTGFGILLERFHLQPRGLIYELKPYPANAISAPPLTPVELGDNEAFWQRATEQGLRFLLPLLTESDGPRSDLRSRLIKLAQLELSPSTLVTTLASWYSAALNHWGVTLQRHGRLSQATPCFVSALQLKSDNLPARANLSSNSNLLAGAKMTVRRSESLEEQFGKYRAWPQLLAANGPFDEPTYCYHLAVACADAQLLRQACQQLERVVALAPDDLYARILLGDVFNRCRLPDRALQVAAAIQVDSKGRLLPPKAEVELAFLQAAAWFAKTNTARAESIIDSLLTSHSDDALLLGRAARLFAARQSYSNALRFASQRVQLSPDEPSALLNQGCLFVLAGSFSNAVPLLTRALSLTNTYTGRIGRAFAYFRTGRLAEAEADYQELLRTFPEDHQAWTGLAEIARQRGDTNAAIRYYQRCLAQTVPGSLEARVVAELLKKFEQGAH